MNTPDSCISTSLGRGDRRGLSMAIGVAAQFETMLRQKDVIGEWSRDRSGREAWAGAFTWENIPGGDSAPRNLQNRRASRVRSDQTRYALAAVAGRAADRTRRGRRHGRRWAADPRAFLSQMVSSDRSKGWPPRTMFGTWMRGPARSRRPFNAALRSRMSSAPLRIRIARRPWAMSDGLRVRSRPSRRRDGRLERRPERRQNETSERRENGPLYFQWVSWSGRQDLNLRPEVPKTSALPGCAIPRTVVSVVFSVS